MQCMDKAVRYTNEEIAQLQKLHTKQLLKKKNVMCGGYCSYFLGCESCKECYDNYQHNLQQLKNILATREHIPNKQESKALRKAKIKKGK